jgi:hypothetical protein
MQIGSGSADYSAADANVDPFAYFKGQLALMLSAGRLVVGWSWQEFLSSLFALLVHTDDNATEVDRLWLRAGINVFVGLLFILIGASMESLLNIYYDDRSQSVSNGSDEDGKESSKGSNNGAGSSITVNSPLMETLL